MVGHVYLTCIFHHLCLYPKSPGCDSVLQPVACSGGTLICCARGESRLVAQPYGMTWDPLRTFCNFTTWKNNSDNFLHFSHSSITFYCHIYLYLENNFILCFDYFCLQALSYTVLVLRQIWRQRSVNLKASWTSFLQLLKVFGHFHALGLWIPLQIFPVPWIFQ